MARNKDCPSTDKGDPFLKLAPPGPRAPRDEVTNFTHKRRVCSCFAFGIGATLGGVRLCSTKSLQDTTDAWSPSIGRPAQLWTSRQRGGRPAESSRP